MEGTAEIVGAGRGLFLSLPEVERLGIVRHAFTTRRNGLGSRSQGGKSPDDWNAVAAAFGIEPDRMITVNQVHGDVVLTVDNLNYRALRMEDADALMSNVPGIAVGIETADCVPILLVDPGARAVAAVHAGWKSTVKRIVAKTIAKMQESFGCEPARMTAAIGPAIGPECYEVDEPVMAPLRNALPFWKEAAFSRGNGRWGLDLVKANSIELAAAGLDSRNIHSVGMCTSCRRDLFYSFRAEGRTGRMLSALMLKQEQATTA